MRQKALVARMKFPSNIATQRIEPGPEVRKATLLPLSYGPRPRQKLKCRICLKMTLKYLFPMSGLSLTFIFLQKAAKHEIQLMLVAKKVIHFMDYFHVNPAVLQPTYFQSQGN